VRQFLAGVAEAVQHELHLAWLVKVHHPATNMCDQRAEIRPTRAGTR
jgi:hypothetical protein